MSTLRAIVICQKYCEIVWYRLKSIFLLLYLTWGVVLCVHGTWWDTYATRVGTSLLGSSRFFLMSSLGLYSSLALNMPNLAGIIWPTSERENIRQYRQQQTQSIAVPGQVTNLTLKWIKSQDHGEAVMDEWKFHKILSRQKIVWQTYRRTNGQTNFKVLPKNEKMSTVS